MSKKNIFLITIFLLASVFYVGVSIAKAQECGVCDGADEGDESDCVSAGGTWDMCC